MTRKPIPARAHAATPFKSRPLLMLLAGFMAALAILAARPALAEGDETAVDDPQGAIAFVRQLTDETRSIWADESLSEQEEYRQFRKVLEKATDIELLSRAILGRYYNRATEEQRIAYMDAMKDYIISEFDQRMEQIGFENLEIRGTSPASGRGGHLFVKTKVKRSEGPPILADWRLRKRDGSFQIVNLEVEGINLLITNREAFSARISEKGLDAVIRNLKERYGPPVEQPVSTQGNAAR
ncbi:MlaC/ttg2D family ABC transporter substrate-binding protein [Yunchengibacter salinarum]|uniref:MlaC/ttg2D family ABC transporter substrate-binding protein n=1 Tax=Yunchengibacter salinarum TaxID=3133399 RepID=UPI0035B657D0